MIAEFRATPRVSENITLEVVEHGGKFYSLNNRRLAALKNAGIDRVAIKRLSLDNAAVFERFARQVGDGLIDDGTMIIVIERAGQDAARQIAEFFGRLTFVPF